MIPPTSPGHSPSPPRPRSLSESGQASRPSAQKIFEEIVHRIPTIREFTEIVYEDVDPDDGVIICQSLVEDERIERRAARVNFNAYTCTLRIKFMLTELHNVHQRWAINAMVEWRGNSLLSFYESLLLQGGAGTTFTGFTGIYQRSSKEPDFFFRAGSSHFPSIVIESGWSESFPHLRNDKDLWMRGCASVELVILVRWTKVSGDDRVKGILEVWRRNGTGDLIATEMQLFPRPNPLPPTELIQFTRGQLFGPALIAGQNPATALTLDVSRLREFAEEVMTMRMGMTPA